MLKISLFFLTLSMVFYIKTSERQVRTFYTSKNIVVTYPIGHKNSKFPLEKPKNSSSVMREVLKKSPEIRYIPTLHREPTEKVSFPGKKLTCINPQLITVSSKLLPIQLLKSNECYVKKEIVSVGNRHRPSIIPQQPTAGVSSSTSAQELFVYFSNYAVNTFEGEIHTFLYHSKKGFFQSEKSNFAFNDSNSLNDVLKGLPTSGSFVFSGTKDNAEVLVTVQAFDVEQSRLKHILLEKNALPQATYRIVVSNKMEKNILNKNI